MLLAGDEMGRTQHGNNNAYCQDNQLSWIDWEHPDNDLLDFTRQLTSLRKNEAVFRHWKWCAAEEGHTGHRITWFSAKGIVLSEKRRRQTRLNRFVALLEERSADLEKNARFLFFFNAIGKAGTFDFPENTQGTDWKKLIDTQLPVENNPGSKSKRLMLQPYSLVVFKAVVNQDTGTPSSTTHTDTEAG